MATKQKKNSCFSHHSQHPPITPVAAKSCHFYKFSIAFIGIITALPKTLIFTKPTQVYVLAKI